MGMSGLTMASTVNGNKSSTKEIIQSQNMRVKNKILKLSWEEETYYMQRINALSNYQV